MDAPALATAQIHQRRRQQISRGGGDQLSDAQPATTGKAAVDQQPAVGSTDQGASDGTAQQQPQCAADLKATIRTEAAETVTDALESLPEEVQHGPDGQQSKPRSCEAQQPTTHCQPLAAISSTALAFSSPSRWADTAAGWKGLPGLRHNRVVAEAAQGVFMIGRGIAILGLVGAEEFQEASSIVEVATGTGHSTTGDVHVDGVGPTHRNLAGKGQVGIALVTSLHAAEVMAAGQSTPQSP